MILPAKGVGFVNILDFALRGLIKFWFLDCKNVFKTKKYAREIIDFELKLSYDFCVSCQGFKERQDSVWQDLGPGQECGTSDGQLYGGSIF